MANIHVIAGIPGTVRLVMHIATPNGNNAIGLPYSTAFLRGIRKGSSVLPEGDGTGATITTAELAELAAGTKFEVVKDFVLGVDFETLSSQLKSARVAAEYDRVAPLEQADISARLKYFGYTL